MKKNLFILGFSIFLIACGSTKSTTSSTTTPPQTVAVDPVATTKEKEKVDNNAAVAIATVATVAEAADFEDKISVDSGKAMYANNCAKCHKLFDAKEFSKEAWGPILVSMQKKAKLGDVEMTEISNYIYSQL